MHFQASAVRFIELITVLAACVVWSDPVGGQCLEFHPALGCAGVWGGSNAPTAIGVHDSDGAGPLPPNLLLAGTFTHGGDRLLNSVGAFDGQNWRAFGGGITSGFGFYPTAVGSFDFDGGGPEPARVIVAGNYASDRVRMFDGTSWISISAGLTTPAIIKSFATVDHDGPGGGPERLYAAPQGNWVPPYLWNGSAWEPLGTFEGGLVSRVRAIDEDGPGPEPTKLFIVGTFTTVNGVAQQGIVSYDGVNFAGVGLLPQGTQINDVAAYDRDGPGPLPTRLYVADRMGVLGPVLERANGVWTRFGTISGGSSTLAVADHDGAGPQLARLYFGLESAVGGVDSVEYWDGATWRPTGFDRNGTLVTSIDYDGSGPGGDRLVVAGSFLWVGDTVEQKVAASGVATFDGTRWTAVQSGNVGGSGFSTTKLVEWDHDADQTTAPQLIAAGDPLGMEGETCGGLAAFDGLWRPLSPSRRFEIQDFSGAMVEYDSDGAGPGAPKLIIAKDFAQFNGVTVNSIVAWNGAAFSTLGNGLPLIQSGTPSRVVDMAVYDHDAEGPIAPDLVVCGTIGSTAQIPFYSILKWNGTAWSALGAGVNGLVSKLVVWDRDGVGPLLPVLVAGGSFTMTGTTPLPRLGVWDGSAWAALPPGPPTSNANLPQTTWDEDGDGPLPPSLIVTYSTSTTAAVWCLTGNTWRALGTTFPNITRVFTLDEDGPGGRPPTLWVHGFYQPAGTDATRQFARWNGSSWVYVDIGVRGKFNHVLVSGTGPATTLYACGTVEYGANLLATGISRITLRPSPNATSTQAVVQAWSGQTAVLQSEIVGDGPLTYTWRRNGSTVADGQGGAAPGGGIVAGASGTLASGGTVSLTIAGAAPQDQGAFTCWVQNLCGEGAGETVMLLVSQCGTSDFNVDGDFGTDADIEAFFACLAGNCCASCLTSDFNGDGDFGTDGDIEAFFRVLAGGNC